MILVIAFAFLLAALVVSSVRVAVAAIDFARAVRSAMKPRIPRAVARRRR